MLIPIEKLYIPFCCSLSQMSVKSFHIWGCLINKSHFSVFYWPNSPRKGNTHKIRLASSPPRLTHFDFRMNCFHTLHNFFKRLLCEKSFRIRLISRQSLFLLLLPNTPVSWPRSHLVFLIQWIWNGKKISIANC